jgi:tRNA(Ile)-lysidine synthase
MRARADQVVRPFLSVRHEATVRFLDDRRWPYRLDSSNLAADHRRNQIRTGVLPVLKHLQPQVVEVLARTASMAQDDFDYLQREALRIERSLDVRDGAEAVGASLGAWQALHPALQRLTLRRLVERLLGRLVDLEEAHVCMMAETLRRASGSETLTGRLPHQLTLEVDGSRFLLRRGRVHSLQGLQPTCLGVPGRVQIEIGTLEASVWEVGDRAELRRAIEVCGPLHALCDAGSVGSTLTVRSRRPGDRMRPLGAPGSRRLQDLLIDRHIPRGARALLPVVENDRHIIWIPGVALDQRAAITPVTEQVLHLRLEPAPGWSVLEYAGIGG